MLTSIVQLVVDLQFGKILKQQYASRPPLSLSLSLSATFLGFITLGRGQKFVHILCRVSALLPLPETSILAPNRMLSPATLSKQTFRILFPLRRQYYCVWRTARSSPTRAFKTRCALGILEVVLSGFVSQSSEILLLRVRLMRVFFFPTLFFCLRSHLLRRR